MDPEKDFLTWYDRALEHHKAGRFIEALADLNTALELAPNDHACWFKRAIVHEDLKNIEQAVKDYTKCIEVFPSLDLVDKNSPNALLFYKGLLGNAYFNRGILFIFDLNNKAAGKADWIKAIELGSEEAEAEMEKIKYNS